MSGAEVALPLPPDGECVEFSMDVDGEPVPAFLLRRGEALYGYLNSCPHTRVPLNWLPGQFLDSDGRLIQCAMHGALFRIEDGACLRGPCAGQGLRSVALRREGERVYVSGRPSS